MPYVLHQQRCIPYITHPSFAAALWSILLPKQLPHPLHHTVLLWVVRVVFTRYLQHRRECLCKAVDLMPYLVRNLPFQSATLLSHSRCEVLRTYMLVYEHNGDILPLLRERIECAFDGGSLGFLVDDEVVLLRVGWVGDVL